MLFKRYAFLGVVGAAVAQRPSSVSICDYYTTALLKDNTAANQHMLLTLVVNTALIGNYTQPNVGVMVPGILNKGYFNGKAVDLLPYFSGGLVSTNNNNTASVMSFLDGGGAAPLMQNKPANDQTSNQYMLVTHLYQYFGVLLGCSMVGKSGFPAYGGEASMYKVHKFMALDADQIGYFITQVGLAAASFGVAKNDVMAVGTALTTLFAYKCSAPAVVVPAQGPQLESICTDTSCPLDPKNATCGLYDNMNGASPHPAVASGSASAAAPTPTTMKTVVMSSTVIEYGQCPGPSSKMPSPAPTMAAAESMTPPASKSEMMSSAAPAPSSGCPPNLSGDYQFPHLIVPVSSEYKMMAYGTSFNGVINSTTSSIFNFDVPPSYQGSQCSLIFLFPQQSQLQTSRFTFSGNGAINFYGLGSPATPSTSYDNAPSVKVNIGTVTVAPGNSYTLANYPCPGGQRVAIKAMASGDTSLNYFQDYNPSPIGLYIRRC